MFIIWGGGRKAPEKRVLEMNCLFPYLPPAVFALNGIRIRVEILAVTPVNVHVKCPVLTRLVCDDTVQQNSPV